MDKRSTTDSDGMFQPVVLYRADRRGHEHTACIAVDGSMTIEELFQKLLHGADDWGPAYGLTIRFATRIGSPSKPGFDKYLERLMDEGIKVTCSCAHANTGDLRS